MTYLACDIICLHDLTSATVQTWLTQTVARTSSENHWSYVQGLMWVGTDLVPDYWCLGSTGYIYIYTDAYIYICTCICVHMYVCTYVSCLLDTTCAACRYTCMHAQVASLRVTVQLRRRQALSSCACCKSLANPAVVGGR